MASGTDRRRRHFDAWPGYVDVLSTLLMVVIFGLQLVEGEPAEGFETQNSGRCVDLEGRAHRESLVAAV